MSDIVPELLELVVCPACRSKVALDYDAHELVCTSAACRYAYPIREGIPVLLIEEARKP